jgi:hypothetical protein
MPNTLLASSAHFDQPIARSETCTDRSKDRIQECQQIGSRTISGAEPQNRRAGDAGAYAIGTVAYAALISTG